MSIKYAMMRNQNLCPCLPSLNSASLTDNRYPFRKDGPYKETI